MPIMTSPPIEGVATDTTFDPTRQELERDFENVQNRQHTFNAKKLLNENALQSARAELIRSLFKQLQRLGVDPSNMESIRAFLDRLSVQDPDLAELFEVAFSSLVTGSDTSMTNAPEENMPPQMDNAGLMGKYQNLAGQVMRES